MSLENDENQTKTPVKSKSKNKGFKAIKISSLILMALAFYGYGIHLLTGFDLTKYIPQSAQNFALEHFHSRNCKEGIRFVEGRNLSSYHSYEIKKISYAYSIFFPKLLSDKGCQIEISHKIDDRYDLGGYYKLKILDNNGKNILSITDEEKRFDQQMGINLRENISKIIYYLYKDEREKIYFTY